MANNLPARRWRRDDWIDLAVAQLKADGPAALTLERICAEAGRTRGSFYHHFESVDRLAAEVATRWRLTETDEIADMTLADPDAMAGLATMARLTDAIDHRLERGVRLLAAAHPAIHALVEETDVRREEVMRALLTRAYGLEPEEARSASRLFHALHQAAVMRAPEDIKGYTRETIRSLVAWLPKRN